MSETASLSSPRLDLPARFPRYGGMGDEHAWKMDDGDRCLIVSGVHMGKSGIVEESHTSPGGHITITVRQDNGERFKTLARNAFPQGRGKRD